MRFGWLALLFASSTAQADNALQCRILDLDFLPVLQEGNPVAPQIVAWLEDGSGTFVDTVYITQSTGTFGIGNRPGRFDFNSGLLWPYGRRITTFPVWSTKQPLRWPSLTFQDGNDDNLSHSVGESTHDFHFCRPVMKTELDAITCPTAEPDTDKGVLTGVDTSRYPPRNDVMANPSVDDPSAAMLSTLNPFDAISQPTPALGVESKLSVSLSPEIPAGSYVLWMEVSKEFDTNATYNETAYPPPMVTFGDYGKPYRGQPSVVYRVPFELAADATAGIALDYAGYGDPDGLDGNLRAPDSTITSNLPGSGTGRLGVISLGSSTFRVRVVSRRELDQTAPDRPRRVQTAAVGATKATLSFIAPGDDYQDGVVQGYEVRLRVGEPITDANFEASTQVTTSLTIAPPRTEQTVTLDGLLPETTYSIGIRAFDNCKNTSPLTVVELTTTDRASAAVDACFIATAAYGSVMANDVERLRGFRDRVLAKSALGELAIEAYYTFGPAVAHLIGESELLRATARGALAPIVGRVR